MKIQTLPLPPLFARERYPFHLLEVGQCFAVACCPTARRAMQQNLSSISRKPSLRGRKFATRCTPDGVGVWRIA